jgi:tRNA modification GTPase
LSDAAEVIADSSLLAVVNKTDLIAVPSSGAWVATSARTGAGIEDLLATISRRLVPSPPAAGAAIPFMERHVKHLRAAGQLAARGDAARAAREIASVTAAASLLGSR